MIRKEQLNQLYLSFVDSYLNFANFALESTWKANCRLELSNCQGNYQVLKISLHTRNSFFTKWGVRYL